MLQIDNEIMEYDTSAYYQDESDLYLKYPYIGPVSTPLSIFKRVIPILSKSLLAAAQKHP